MDSQINTVFCVRGLTGRTTQSNNSALKPPYAAARGETNIVRTPICLGTYRTALHLWEIQSFCFHIISQGNRKYFTVTNLELLPPHPIKDEKQRRCFGTKRKQLETLTHSPRHIFLCALRMLLPWRDGQKTIKRTTCPCVFSTWL